MMDRTKRCYLYIRVSTDKQEEEGYSLPEQEERLRAEAEKKGFQVVDLFADRGVSGKNGYVKFLVENGFVTKPCQNSVCKIIG